MQPLQEPTSDGTPFVLFLFCLSQRATCGTEARPPHSLGGWSESGGVGGRLVDAWPPQRVNPKSAVDTQHHATESMSKNVSSVGHLTPLQGAKKMVSQLLDTAQTILEEEGVEKRQTHLVPNLILTR